MQGFGLADTGTRIATWPDPRQGRLAKLPAEDRPAFTRLWDDVAALLKKTEQKGK
jgi:hypothetical protein